MSDVTTILNAINAGDPQAIDQLLPLVYDELRKLAAAQMAHEKSGQTLDATALVHEAYLRLAGTDKPQGAYGSRRYFFAAAAEAMRRILIESARRKKRLKRGGEKQRVEFDEQLLSIHHSPDELLRVDEALERLGQDDPPAAEIVKICYFAGYSVEQAADVLEMSRATAYRHWKYARAWLWNELKSADS